jgi:hypothetical protein
MPQRTRSSHVDVPIQCRVCPRVHVVHGVAELLRQPISFGGAPRDTSVTTTAGWAGPVTCPDTHLPFEAELSIPAEFNESVHGFRIESVTDAAGDGDGVPPVPPTTPTADVPDTAPPADWIDDELKEWRQTTVATQRTYATTMLTASSGAVAVYFAVLQYLGWEKANFGTGLVILTIAPPVLLFCATAAFALALRPSLTFLTRSEYAEFRARRVEQMHRRSTIGTLLYAIALAMAVIVFISILEANS